MIEAKLGSATEKKEKERDSRLRCHLESVNWQMKCPFCVCEHEFGIERPGGVEWKLKDTYGVLMMTHVDSMTHTLQSLQRIERWERQGKEKNTKSYSHLSLQSESVNWQIKCSLLCMWVWIARLGERWRNQMGSSKTHMDRDWVSWW